MDAQVINRTIARTIFLFSILFLVLILGLPLIFAGTPTGPDTLLVTYNSTKPTSTSKAINISGGYIAIMNITSNSQDLKWKGFVGYVSGKYSLSDAAGSTIYDWSLVSGGGRVYATRNATNVNWANINCSNFTMLNNENYLLNITSPNDNVTVTFNTAGTLNHTAFTVGSISIPANTCYSTKTYVNNATHADFLFEEVPLMDGTDVIYSTRIQPTRPVGYNNLTYDFQMIVPENGLATWTGSTAYYMYVELG